jgi:hypothetical protein
MHIFLNLVFLLAATAAFAGDYDSYNSKVGHAQGGEKIFVKSGGEIDIEEGGAVNFDGVDVKIGEKQATAFVEDISGDASFIVAAPFPGTVTSIAYSFSGDAGATTVACAKINGTLITDSCVEVTSDAGAVVELAEPSAANTIAAGDRLEVTNDAAATNTISIGVVYTIKP